jgi:cyclomaltodextrinase / maltogenic alpha-amylase / neopullulanase
MVSVLTPPPSGNEPAWVEHAIWWHVYPLGFTGADTTGRDRRPAHRLQQIVGWLDHAVSLGASGLALGPIFASGSHGYDTMDHFAIDPRLGDDADFDLLVAEAHRHGLRVLLDGVFNHVGAEFPAFVAAAAGGSSDWFVPEGGGFAVFEGHPGLPVLNHDNPAVAGYVADVMTHWLGRGADGWRLDAAYAVPSAFWAEVLPRVRATHPDAYFVGEVLHGDYAAIVAAGELSSVTQYELWKAIWSSLHDRNLFELAWALGRHNGWLSHFAPLTFVGNHDVTRIASQVGDPRHLPHALVILMTVGGTPSIYYGDEYGWTGVKEARVGGDDAVRPAFPSSPVDIDGDVLMLRLHQDLIGLRRRHSWLHRATTTVVSLTNQQLVYDVSSGTDRLRVLLNLADTALRHDWTGQAVAGAAVIEAGTASVPPHGWAVIAA